jgi:hypothetical protein
MTIIKWYKGGEFTEEQYSDKLLIVKLDSDDGVSWNGYRFFVGYLRDDDKFYSLENINPEEFEKIGIPISFFKHIQYKDSINIKLGKIWLTNDHLTTKKGFKIWKYAELVKIYGEENITFYHEK